MASYHKWDVKNGFDFVLQFFSHISDGLGGVMYFDNLYDKKVIYPKCPFCSENILTASAAAGLKEGTKNLKSLSSL